MVDLSYDTDGKVARDTVEKSAVDFQNSDLERRLREKDEALATLTEQLRQANTTTGGRLVAGDPR